MTESTERLSTALADRYQILSRLGEGGMATVYLAEDLKHDRKVAVKVLRPELAAVLGADRFDSVIDAGGRVIQVNVWRPISGPVQRAPLALADAASIASQELVITEQRFPDRVGEIYNLAFSPTQRWYWAPEMQRDEVLLIKGWDSGDDGRARFTPHGAFVWQRDADSPPRESIEARAYLVFET